VPFLGVRHDDWLLVAPNVSHHRLADGEAGACKGQASAFGFQAWNSLSRRWLPKFDLVALRVHDPTELPVPGIVCLLQDVRPRWR